MHCRAARFCLVCCTKGFVTARQQMLPVGAPGLRALVQLNELNDPTERKLAASALTVWSVPELQQCALRSPAMVHATVLKSAEREKCN